MFDTRIYEVGENTIIDPAVEICLEHDLKDGRGIFIGRDCVIYPRNRLVLGDMNANPEANMVIGKNVLINAGAIFPAREGFK